jgi:hypothetical protein
VEALIEYRPDFDVFKSSICHRLKHQGDIDFILNVLETNEIWELYSKHWHLESLYLLAMLDYLSRENDIPLVSDYNELRHAKLQDIVYPVGIHVRCITSGNDEAKYESFAEAIPEFLRHNIVEAEVRNVY